MNQDFVNYIKENIVGFLPDNLRDAEISISEVTKGNNRKLTSLQIGDPYRGVPQIYLDEYEEQYINGRGMNEILQEIVELRLQAETELHLLTFEPSSFLDYEVAKPKLAIRMCDYNASKDFLKDMPYTRIANLAATYRINAVEGYYSDGYSNKVANVQSLAITNNFLDDWQITTEELHRDALSVDSNKRGVTFVSVPEFLEIGFENAENFFYRQEPIRWKISDMYQLSNNYVYNGASVIMQDGVLEKVGELLGRDFYVIPSSIHEVMIRPATQFIKRSKLVKTLKNANRDVCTPDEVLSDKLLYYNRKQGALYSI